MLEEVQSLDTNADSGPMFDAIHMKRCSRKEKESGKRGLLVQQICLSVDANMRVRSLHHVFRSRYCKPEEILSDSLK